MIKKSSRRRNEDENAREKLVERLRSSDFSIGAVPRASPNPGKKKKAMSEERRDLQACLLHVWSSTRGTSSRFRRRVFAAKACLGNRVFLSGLILWIRDDLISKSILAIFSFERKYIVRAKIFQGDSLNKSVDLKRLTRR